MRRKYWLIPLGLFAVAILLGTAGLGWAIVTGVAIPDQDPTPAMQAYAKFHITIVFGLFNSGLVLFAIAALATAVLAVGAWVSRG